MTAVYIIIGVLFIGNILLSISLYQTRKRFKRYRESCIQSEMEIKDLLISIGSDLDEVTGYVHHLEQMVRHIQN